MAEKNIIRVEEIEKSIEKLKFHIDEENSLMDDLNIQFDKILENYKTENSNEFYDISTEIINKSKVIINNHDNNITVLTKKCEGYKDTSRKVQQIFDNLK